MRLQQASLATGAELPRPPGAIIQLAVTRDEGGIVSTGTEFAVTNLSQDEVSLYALILEPAPAESEAAAPATPVP